MRIITLLTLILSTGSLALAAVPPELLTLGDLANHPDRCPPTVRMSSDVRFGDGVTLHRGQVVQVLDFNGSDLNVGTGTDARYTVGPNDCDLLAAANAAWARLSPRQRAVDAKAVLADASLWPERVKCFLAGTSNGRSIPTGTEYVLRAFDQTGVSLYYPEGGNHFGNIDIKDTDLLVRAREKAALDTDQRSSRIAEALKTVSMLNADGQPQKAPLDRTKVFVLYYGANWCTWCHRLSPTLVKTINQIAPDNPGMTVVMLDDDDQVSEMQAYMKAEKMPWSAVPKADWHKPSASLLAAFGGLGIPELLILDRYGKVIYDHAGGGPADIAKNVQALQRFSRSGAAKI